VFLKVVASCKIKDNKSNVTNKKEMAGVTENVCGANSETVL